MRFYKETYNENANVIVQDTPKWEFTDPITVFLTFEKQQESQIDLFAFVDQKNEKVVSNNQPRYLVDTDNYLWWGDHCKRAFQFPKTSLETLEITVQGFWASVSMISIQVVNYSILPPKNAMVTIYKGSGLMKQYNIPPLYFDFCEGTDVLWVCDIVPKPVKLIDMMISKKQIGF